MKFEDTIQFAYDFYPSVSYNRQKVLDHLFCVIGNGYGWIDGELVCNDDYLNRWGLKIPVTKANPTEMCKIEENFSKTKEKILMDRNPDYIPHKWYPISKTYSYILNYPENIKPDWKAGIEECLEMLREDGIDV